MSSVTVVVGGQFGSEAKGHVTEQIVRASLDIPGMLPMVVRVAGPNAGHTCHDNKGRRFAFRQLPVGIVLEPQEGGTRVTSVIAAGSEIDPDVLLDEIARVKEAGHQIVARLAIDYNATLIQPHHRNQETNGHLTDRLGSTGKGIGAARADRIWRKARRLIDDPKLVRTLTDLGARVMDTRELIEFTLSRVDTSIVVEGTQGYGLGFHTQYYPKSTSSDCRAIDFLAMAGISPWHPDLAGVAVAVVCREYPIRVAGNSGPLKDETTWEELGLPEERTTVTQKVRRVGGWDASLVNQAVMANGGGLSGNSDRVGIALTMVDQKFPYVAGLDTLLTLPVEQQNEILEHIKQVEEDAGAKVHLITTGPRTAVWMR